MFILKKGHQPGVYMPLRALFLVYEGTIFYMNYMHLYEIPWLNSDLISFKFSN